MPSSRPPSPQHVSVLPTESRPLGDSEPSKAPPYPSYPEYGGYTYPSEGRGYAPRASFAQGPYARYAPPSLGSLPSRSAASTLPTPPTPPTPNGGYRESQTSGYPFPPYQQPPQPSSAYHSQPYPSPHFRPYDSNGSISPGGMSPYYDPRSSMSSVGYFDQQRPAFQDRIQSYQRGGPLPSPTYETRPGYSSSWQENRGPGGKREEDYGRDNRDRLPTLRDYERGDSRERDIGGAPGDRDNTTPFISKLSHLLSHPEYSGFIRWSGDGESFIFAHTSTDLLEVFSRFFRHSNAHSFVRQLNIYGFTRLTTLDMIAAIDSAPHPGSRLTTGDYSAFTHPEFWRSSPHRPCPLSKLKPRVSKKKKDGGSKLESGLITRPRLPST